MSGVARQLRPKFTLTILAIGSAVVCALVSFLGPFDWYVYSEEGLAVFFAIEGFFVAGLALGEYLRPRGGGSSRGERVQLTRLQSGILMMASCLSLLCFLYLVQSFMGYYGQDYEIGGTFYEFNEEGRGVLGRICTVLLQLGMASFLLYAPYWDRTRWTKNALIVLSFWTTAAYYALCGSRFSLVASAIVFVVAFISRRKTQKTFMGKGKARDRRGARVIALVLIAALFIVVLGGITMNRMNVSSRIPENHMEFVAGDSPLKESYEELAEAMGSLSNSIFSLADYIGEAPFVFSYLYENHFPEQVYFGAHTLRSLSQGLSGFGLDLMHNEGEVAAETSPNISKYSGIGFSLMVDFGSYVCFMVAMFFGFIFGRVSACRGAIWLCRSLFPCVTAMSIFAPVYFFTVGRLDYVVVEVLFIYALMALLRPLGLEALKNAFGKASIDTCQHGHDMLLR